MVEDLKLTGAAECVKFYKDFYSQDQLQELDFSALKSIPRWNTLSENNKTRLERSITRHGITKALSDFDSDEAPVTDGFTFLKATWIIIEDEFLKAIRTFFKQGGSY